jgi:hypothetical protein
MRKGYVVFNIYVGILSRIIRVVIPTHHGKTLPIQRDEMLQDKEYENLCTIVLKVVDSEKLQNCSKRLSL